MDSTQLFIGIIFAVMVSYAIYGTAKNYREMKSGVTDEFYKQFEINSEQFKMYQYFINSALNLETISKAQSAKDISKSDLAQLDQLIVEVEKAKLNKNAFEVMVFQWVYADSYDRSMQKSSWVETVTNRNNGPDYFPSAYSVYKMIYE